MLVCVYSCMCSMHVFANVCVHAYKGCASIFACVSEHLLVWCVCEFMHVCVSVCVFIHGTPQNVKICFQVDVNEKWAVPSHS